MLQSKPKFNDKQEEDRERYYREAIHQGSDVQKANTITDIRFNHKYTFHPYHNRWIMKDSYIERKINKIKNR